MQAPEKKMTIVRLDKLFYPDGYDRRNNYSVKIVDERFKGTFKEAFRTVFITVSLLIPENKDEPTFTNLQSSWTKHVSNDRLFDKQLDALFDKYLLYYVVHEIFEVLNAKNENSVQEEEINITLQSDPNDVDRFVEYISLFPDVPEKGKWSEIIEWVSDK